MSPVRLVSDFREPHYDFMFRPDGKRTYRRMSEEGPDKFNQFLMLSKMGFRIPPVGTVEYLYHLCDEEDLDIQVVVYLNQFKHAGEGKALMPIGKAYETFPSFFASVYVANAMNKPMSYRALMIGDKTMYMKYTSDDLWKSNNGNVEIVECELPDHCGYERILLESKSLDVASVPMLAIDFVPSRVGTLMAIDLNVAPGIQGTPATKKFDAVTIYETIQRHLYDYRPLEWVR